jgi:hypothetical protein
VYVSVPGSLLRVYFVPDVDEWLRGAEMPGCEVAQPSAATRIRNQGGRAGVRACARRKSIGRRTKEATGSATHLAATRRNVWAFWTLGIDAGCCRLMTFNGLLGFRLVELSGTSSAGYRSSYCISETEACWTEGQNGCRSLFAVYFPLILFYLKSPTPVLCPHLVGRKNMLACSKLDNSSRVVYEYSNS